MKSLFEKILPVCHWLYRVMVLQLYCIGGILVGGIVLGIFPSIIAACDVYRLWDKEEEPTVHFQKFWHAYKENFWRGNRFGLFFVVACYLLYTEVKIVQLMEGWVSLLLYAVLLSITIMLGVVMLYVFPLIAHTTLSVWKTIRTALLLGMVYILPTIGGVFTFVVLYYIFLVFPSLVVLLGISVPLYISHSFYKFAFNLNERRKAA